MNLNFPAGTTPARNVHTGDLLVSKRPTNAYRDGWDRIFGKKEEPEQVPKEDKAPSDKE